MQANPSNTSPVAPADQPRTAQFQLAPARVTPILIGLNVLVYVVMVISGISPTEPTVPQLIAWGANFGPLTASGQWWRLLTACFLHIGFIHIALNMYILYQAGLFVERLYGGLRFLVLYLVAGIGGNLAGVLLHPMIVSAGASGAIFGVYGGLLAFLLRQRAVIRPEAAKAIGRSALIFIGINLFYGLATPHTDLTAHVGGIVTGFLAGLFLVRPLPVLPARSSPPRISGDPMQPS